MGTSARQDVAIAEIMQSLRRIIKSLQVYSQNVYSHFGITGPQLWALKTLQQAGNLSLGELGQAMYLHASTVTGLVDRLEKRGWVARDRTEEDRRVVNVHLTSKGRSLARKTPNPVQGKMIYGLRKLGKEELARIQISIQQLVAIMEAQDLKVTFIFDEERPATSSIGISVDDEGGVNRRGRGKTVRPETRSQTHHTGGRQT